MNLSCEIVQDLLPLYCDGACSAESRQCIDQHLQTCQRCRRDLLLMQDEHGVAPPPISEQAAVSAAAKAWKRGKKSAFLRGCLLVLLLIVAAAVADVALHWFSSADGDDQAALARQAADYWKKDALQIVKTQQRGNYMAALCRDAAGNLSMCVFDRDSVFSHRWRANGGTTGIDSGKIGSWNYGSPAGEAVLIFFGGDLPAEICWYTFQNSGVTYTCPVSENTVLDVFVIPDEININGTPMPLDEHQQALEQYVV